MQKSGSMYIQIFYKNIGISGKHRSTRISWRARIYFPYTLTCFNIYMCVCVCVCVRIQIIWMKKFFLKRYFKKPESAQYRLVEPDKT